MTTVVVHAGLKTAVSALLATVPRPDPVTDPVAKRAQGTQWQAGLQGTSTLPAELPPLRLRLVWDHVTGPHTPARVLWRFSQGVMGLYPPLSGRWLHRAASLPRLLARRALAGQHPQTPQQIIALLEATARGWNAAPTPFVWGGKRATRRARARERRHALGGSGACTLRPLRRRVPAYKNGNIRGN